MKTTIALLFTLVLTVTTSAGNAWRQYASVEEAGYDPAALASARAFADKAQSSAVFAVAHGNVIAAWGAVDRKLELHSVRKSLYSALWGIAESRKLVNVEATLETLGIDDLQHLTTEEKKARLVDLLHARSGVYHPSAYAPSDQQEALPARGSHAPDTFWFYNNWDFNVAGVLLERVSGQPLGRLFGEWIARPTGMEDYQPGDVTPVLEPGASQWPALTVRMSARDLARFGLLWLNEGRWNGKQIVPAAWIARASASASSTGAPGQGYGMMWWTYEKGSVDAQRYPNASRVRVVLARGTGGQAIAVIPEADLVIVHRADTDNSRRVSGRDVWTIIDQILGARRGRPEAAYPRPEAAYPRSRTVNPRLSAVRNEPFASQLPPFAWPTAVPLEPAGRDALLGNYELRPGMIARVFLHDGRLYASMPGQGDAELFALSPTEFFVRVDPSARIRFALDAAGKPSRVVVSIGGKEMTARRVQK